MSGLVGELVEPVAEIDGWNAALIARVHGHVAEFALILHPMYGAVVVLVRAGDPHVVILTVDPEAGVTHGPVVGVEVVGIGEECVPIPETPGITREVVVVGERRDRGRGDAIGLDGPG